MIRNSFPSKFPSDAIWQRLPPFAPRCSLVRPRGQPAPTCPWEQLRAQAAEMSGLFLTLRNHVGSGGLPGGGRSLAKPVSSVKTPC